jgi:hypothetical protein
MSDNRLPGAAGRGQLVDIEGRSVAPDQASRRRIKIDLLIYILLDLSVFTDRLDNDLGAADCRLQRIGVIYICHGSRRFLPGNEIKFNHRFQHSFDHPPAFDGGRRVEVITCHPVTGLEKDLGQTGPHRAQADDGNLLNLF